MAQVLDEKLVDKAETCAVQGRSIHDDLHLMYYIMAPGLGEAMINFDQLKAFYKVDHRNIYAVFRTASIGPVVRGLIATLYSGIHLVIRVKSSSVQTIYHHAFVSLWMTHIIASVLIYSTLPLQKLAPPRRK